MKSTLFLTALFVSYSTFATANVNVSHDIVQGEWMCQIPYNDGKAMDYFTQDLRPDGQMVTTGTLMIQKILTYEYMQAGKWSLKDNVLTIHSEQNNAVRVHSKETEQLLNQNAQLRQAEAEIFRNVQEGSDLSNDLSLQITELTNKTMTFLQTDKNTDSRIIGECRKRQ